MMKTLFPRFDVLQNADHWDEKTAEVVNDRMFDPTATAFLIKAEADLLKVICARLLADDHNHRLNQVVAHIDKKLAQQISAGYRKINIPEGRRLYRNGLMGMEQASGLMFDGKKFADLTAEEQDNLLDSIRAGKPPGEAWYEVPAKDFFTSMLRDALEIYCSLPGVWSAMGYAGPAYPRGYVRIELGGVDPWEAVRTDD